DVTERLKRSDAELYKRVSEVLAKNRAERHLRGGNATRLKYLDKRAK
ncbi:MAG: sporulation transcriptional regulator SpoIIID, partial [Clostridia bacterium]|nr:sporulation transcriptional regulator SpoIIID [Clostridia bacterium]